MKEFKFSVLLNKNKMLQSRTQKRQEVSISQKKP